MLAAVVLHMLVTDGREGMTHTQVARVCERDPESATDMRETSAALALLIADDLAERDGDVFKPTRAAIRANELSF